MASTRGKSIFVIVMGVSGSGKTTIGITLARAMSVSFLDADQLHPASNIAKMRAGIPLTDDDRLAWLQIISQQMDDPEVRGQGLVIGCSSLKVKYRRILRGFSVNYDPNSAPSPDSPAFQRQVHFLYLKGTFDELRARIEGRVDHFMPASLLQSQFDALEEPTEDEGIETGKVGGRLVVAGIESSPEEIVSRFMEVITWAS